jgi:CSLREA domain-containing protein
MTGSTVAENTAVFASHELINTGTATITNSTISGAGLKNSGTTHLSFVTVVGETAVTNGTLNANNTIFTACSGTITSQGHNLIANTTGCTITGDTTGSITDQSALLDVLDDNGGPTPTHALLDGSPAIEAGSNTNCPATDQRGVSRPLGAFCDIGAYEDENPTQSDGTVIVNTDDDSNDGACTLLHCTLREAIIAANGTADNIHFNISGSAPYVIQPLSELPPLTAPVVLDGTTQPGGIVTLDGFLAGSDANGLILAGGSSVVRGLVITNFGCNGIVLASSGNVVEANAITGNGCHGVQVLSGSSNSIRDNSIANNGLLGISLAGDEATRPSRASGRTPRAG